MNLGNRGLHDAAKLWSEQCRKLRTLAQQIIDGQVGVVEGSSQMVTLRFLLHAREDSAFSLFAHVDALKRKAENIRELDELYRDGVIEAAVRIKSKYK